MNYLKIFIRFSYESFYTSSLYSFFMISWCLWQSGKNKRKSRAEMCKKKKIYPIDHWDFSRSASLCFLWVIHTDTKAVHTMFHSESILRHLQCAVTLAKVNVLHSEPRCVFMRKTCLQHNCVTTCETLCLSPLWRLSVVLQQDSQASPVSALFTVSWPPGSEPAVFWGWQWVWLLS